VEPHKRETLRCAIYTRKSSEEGLEQDFNSLHAQREACEAFIKSQAGEGWRLVTTPYDDGGVSGGTMERPALQRLLADIRENLVDIVVVYKVDRLTRSLADFAKMVEVFDAHGISFVAVTQQFNTTTSMGRLTLNVLLSFAQFEREVTGERIRDKIAASKRKGMWMGGLVPLGYEVRDRQLAIVESEATTVRHIFGRYVELASVRLLKAELDRDGIRSKVRVAKNGLSSGGCSFARGALYTLLGNPIYIGEVRHKGARHPGLHQAIVQRARWDKTQELLRSLTMRSDAQLGGSVSNPLAGKLFDEGGERLAPCGAAKGERRYRYYVSRSLLNGAACKARRGWRLPAHEIERSVATATRKILSDVPAIAAEIERAGHDVSQTAAILDAAGTWSRRLQSEAEISTALKSLIERVELRDDRLRLSIQLPFNSSDGSAANQINCLAFTREIPLQTRRRGVEMKFIVDGNPSDSGRADPALIKLLARAHCWFAQLVSGQSESMVKLGEREHVGKRYVSRVIRLAFLAPEIVELIVEGRQPPELTAQRLLTDRSELPLSWRAQKEVLGIARPV
jgi:DNA invertase Pin-like site-specific DNA recombinase